MRVPKFVHDPASATHASAPFCAVHEPRPRAVFRPPDIGTKPYKATTAPGTTSRRRLHPGSACAKPHTHAEGVFYAFSKT